MSLPTLRSSDVAVIALWFCALQPLAGSPLLPRYWRMLHAQEQTQYLRLRRPADRLRYLVTRALVRTVLSEQAAVLPEQWQFGHTPHGKPVVTGPAGLPAGLDFSVSHTDELIVLALHRQGSVGVDAERWQGRTPPFEVTPVLLTPAEQQALSSLPACDQALRFFQYWSLKEAYVKALGMGLSHPLTAFSFRFDSPGALQFFSDEGGGVCGGARWCFWQLEVQGHCIAVCADVAGQPPALQARMAQPLQGSTPLELCVAWSTDTCSTATPAILGATSCMGLGAIKKRSCQRLIVKR
ncbi:hypothetical protein ACDW_02050 [Acidovorax sp. DW039]|uniref:4'-phosphopantetheinyl transferase family protein n=1 Tax=Acidovorax sp. DW039 TaxID=3095606 RepID=UPI003084EEB7|nr:hypothetical protein ACDW_02050 [Acidovorax sp. DW039]